MDPTSELERLCARALDLPEDQRRPFLERELAGREQLVSRVLAALGTLGAIPSEPGEETAALKPEDETPRFENARQDDRDTDRSIDGYRLLEPIGRGGFGVVYLAEQQQPVRRRVALKIIKAGMDTRQVVARFQAERQALALMDHPHIARVLDAGTTDRGRPYFVMEYVRGEPIHRFCDRERLSLEERVELFVQVCEAVQHAHTKGIIHRDLKPSNVLVEYVDGRPTAKVIDFGVAKALHQRLSEDTVFTELGQVIGTPEYMSPEQAEMSGLDIDTRTDVYSLGVMLYELLTGLLPFERASLLERGIGGLQRYLREVEPPRPSTRLTRASAGSTTDDTLVSLARQRRLEPRSLHRRLHGDLDWIVMRCLEKERGRRYESPRQLADDLQSYLAGRPVLAGPPTLRYRARKFVRRNRGLVVAGATVLTVLVLGLVGTSIGFVRAEQRRIDAEIARDRLELQTVRLRLSSGDASAARQQLMRRYHPALASEWRWAAWDYLRRSRELDSRDLTRLFPEDTVRLMSRTAGGWAEVRVDDASIVVNPTLAGEDSRWNRGGNGGPSTKPFAIDMRSWSRRALPSVITDGLPVLDLPGGRSVLVARGRVDGATSDFTVPDAPWDRRFGGEAVALVEGAAAPGDRIPTERLLWSRNAPVGGAFTALDAEPESGTVAFVEGGAISLYRDAGDSLEPAETLPSLGDLISALTLETASRRIHAVTGRWRYVALGLDPDPDIRRIQVTDNPEHTTRSLTFDADGGRIATLSYYGQLNVFDVETGERLASDDRHDPTRYRTGDVMFLSNELVMSGAQDGFIRVWNWRSGEETQTIACGVDPCRFATDAAGERLFLKFSPAERFEDPDFDLLREVRLETGELVTSFGAETVDASGRPIGETIYSLALSADGETLYSARTELRRQSPEGNHAVVVWDTASRRRVAMLDSEGWSRDLALDAEDRLLALATGIGTVEIWDTRSYRRLHVLETSPGSDHTNIVSTVHFDPTGPLLAAGSHDDRITLWEPFSGTLLAELAIPSDEGYGFTGRLKELRFSPDGRLLAVGFGTELLLIDLRHWDRGIERLAAERDAEPDPAPR